VLGKMLTHSVQVGYAALGGCLLFFAPLLLGGVIWNEILRIVLVLLFTLLLSLACGMFWSTMSSDARTTVLATVVSMLLLTLLPWLWLFIEVNLLRSPVRLVGLPQASPMTALIAAFESNYRTLGAWGVGGAFTYWGTLFFGFMCSVVLLAASGWLLPRVWRRAEAGEQMKSRAKPQGMLKGVSIRTPAWMTVRNAAPLRWLASRALREPLWMRWVRGLTLAFFSAMLVASVTTSHWEEGFVSAFCTAYGLHLVTRVQFTLAATKRLHEDRRSGALEALLTTPVSDAEFIRAHHESLKRAFRWPQLMLLGMNVALQSWVILFYKQLHMEGGAGTVFSVFFIGGALVTQADFAALRWLGLREALRSRTPMKAAGRTFGVLMIVPWAGFGAAFPLAISMNHEEFGALTFLVWFAFCLHWDWAVIQLCRHWLRPGLRRRASEI
jgi:hypothetical protein